MAKILIIGNGGREHALAWSLAQENAHELYIAPGNPGTAQLGRNVDIGVDDLAGLLDFARDNSVDMTIVGPEAPLADGIVDLFQGHDQPIFGPRAEAAQLEASKLYARDFMHANDIPHPGYAACENADEVWAAVEEFGLPIVLKADGLAAGKGVIICHDKAEVQAGIDTFFTESSFGDAGKLLSVEECLVGTEMSVFALCDGDNFCLLGTAQDYKRAYNNDEGPNTGGMGSISPSRFETREMLEEISATIIQPTLDGMKQRGTPYVGFLYAGLMIVAGEPIVIEFNVRMGDPETQVVLPRMDQPLYPLIEAAVQGRVPIHYRVKPEAATCVVLAAEGYPGSYKKGQPINGLDDLGAGITVFQAGTKLDGGQLVSSGGRVLSLVGRGADVAAAAEVVYRNMNKLDFPGSFHRTDIGGG